MPAAPPERQSPKGGTGRTVSARLVISVVLAVLALVFILQNTGSGRVVFFFWTVDQPVWIWLVLILAAGLVVGSLFPWFGFRRKK